MNNPFIYGSSTNDVRKLEEKDEIQVYDKANIFDEVTHRNVVSVQIHKTYWMYLRPDNMKYLFRVKSLKIK